MRSKLAIGEVSRCFLGKNNGQWRYPGCAWLLGCDCGEVGCWPLEARIIADRHDSSTGTAYRDGRTCLVKRMSSAR